ncbi:MAG TPA: helix-turn-helix domain-containing protein [Thermoleophilaceae bacterium]|nr:helix-turn-helix domain-containing protein [Thermoleophilaceae bacterium]
MGVEPYQSSMTFLQTATDQPAREDIDLGAVLHALSDPIRLEIVAALDSRAEACPTGSFEVPVSKSTCTHHFRVLREAGVVRQRREGTARLNTLRRDDLEARFPGLLDAVLDAKAG